MNTHTDQLNCRRRVKRLKRDHIVVGQHHALAETLQRHHVCIRLLAERVLRQLRGVNNTARHIIRRTADDVVRRRHPVRHNFRHRNGPVRRTTSGAHSHLLIM